MQLNHGLHLAYCTNVHPGEDWAQTFHSLNRWTLRVRDRVCPGSPYAIGLRLSDQASRELSDPPTLLEFQHWLEEHDCYLFTINGFPFGRFHGARVKEQVYLPDWTSPERLAYTNRLFDLLAQLLPPGIEGSVSTAPGSFKEFIHSPEQEKVMHSNLWRCVEHIERTSRRTGHNLHLGLEPEPFGYLENTAETVAFFERLEHERSGDDRLKRYLGINYDTCHFAVAFEDPREAINRFQAQRIKLSKIHISNALKLPSKPEALCQLAAFNEDIYLHQVNIRAADGSLRRYKDLDVALNACRDNQSPHAGGDPEPANSGILHNDRSLLTPTAAVSKSASKSGDAQMERQESEWRVHFHIPLQSPPLGALRNTQDHILGLFAVLEKDPKLCSHLEMETYTWAVLPAPLKTRDVVEQIEAEYAWTLARLAEHSLCNWPNLKPGHP